MKNYHKIGKRNVTAQKPNPVLVVGSVAQRQNTARMASDALVWQCVKGNNSFVRKSRNAQTKRNGAIMLSAEPGNLTSQHSFKYSGIANSKVIKFDVDEVDGKGTKITLGCKVNHCD